MKTRLSLLLLCSSLFASFAGGNQKEVYSWTVINSDKEILARFLYWDLESDKIVVEKNNTEYKIPFERLTKNLSFTSSFSWRARKRRMVNRIG